MPTVFPSGSFPKGSSPEGSFPEGPLDFTKAELKIAELYTFTLTNGVVARFTNHQKDISYGGNTWQAFGKSIGRTAVKYHADLTVDTVTIAVGITGVTIGAQNYTIPEIIHKDFLRRAYVKVEAIDYEALGEPVYVFDGYVSGEISYNDAILTLKCGSILDRLKNMFPKVLYTEQCNHRVFDAYCGLDKTAWDVNGTVLAGSGTQIIYASIFEFASYASGYWKQGEIHMTSGNNDGISRTMYYHGDGYIKLLKPFPESIAENDTFWAVPGCDRTGKTCDEKFSNYPNFLGFEYIPRPEDIYFA